MEEEQTALTVALEQLRIASEKLNHSGSARLW